MGEVKIKYIATTPTYSIGKLYINNVYQCDTLTPPLRGVYVRGISAVPRGNYTLSMEHVSPRFSAKEPYRSYAGGKVPRVMGFSGSPNILFHVGNSRADTEGCFLLGLNTIKGRLTTSRTSYIKVVQALAKEKQWKLTIE